MAILSVIVIYSYSGVASAQASWASSIVRLGWVTSTPWATSKCKYVSAKKGKKGGLRACKARPSGHWIFGYAGGRGTKNSEGSGAYPSSNYSVIPVLAQVRRPYPLCGT